MLFESFSQEWLKHDKRLPVYCIERIVNGFQKTEGVAVNHKEQEKAYGCGIDYFIEVEYLSDIGKSARWINVRDCEIHTFLDQNNKWVFATPQV